VCTECWNRTYSFAAAVALGEFEAPLARIVSLHKDGPEARLGPVLGRRLGGRVAVRWPGWAEAVVWVPASPVALRRRGFDHASGIAEGAAEALGVPAVRALRRANAQDQRRLGRTDRARNVADVFEACGDVPGRRIVLVDDVMTTGSTLDAAAGVLLASGVDEVRVAAVARVW